MPTPNPDYMPNPQAKDGIDHAARPHGRASTACSCASSRCRTRTRSASGRTRTTTRRSSSPSRSPARSPSRCCKAAARAAAAARWKLGGRATQKLTFTVKDTGGFQNFEAREVGTVKIEKAGRHTLTVQAEDQARRRGDGPAAGGVEAEEVSSSVSGVYHRRGRVST